MNKNTQLAFVDSFLSHSCQQQQDTIADYYSIDEHEYLSSLIDMAEPDSEELLAINTISRTLIEMTRASNKGVHMVDKLLQEYSLSDEDGVTLMCLAEALLRIPDTQTRDALIKDKLSAANWKRHLQEDSALFVNASTWGLMFAGRFVKISDTSAEGMTAGLQKLIYQCGAPALRQAMKVAMKIIGEYFVLGRTIDEADQRSLEYRQQGCCYSYDMLGEAAHTRADAKRYLDNYMLALKKLANFSDGHAYKHSLSIKISALHPRYEESQREKTLNDLFVSVSALVKQARDNNIAITIDAEEADRLELSLELFKRIYQSPVAKGWAKFGVVVQAYSKRALPVLCWLTSLAKSQGDEIPVRLVKGAYWDSEIKHCQELGIDGYPVFTRKEATDTSYIACARFLLSDDTRGAIYPQFASHNAHTIASVVAMSNGREYEFQRLHGMGEGLYTALMQQYPDINIRIYAPVGSHEDLLPYLVRRLLENGANGSFVHRLQDACVSVDELIAHPVSLLRSRKSLANHRIPLPENIFSDRLNSKGENLNTAVQRIPFMKSLEAFSDTQWHGEPLLAKKYQPSTDKKIIHSPYKQDKVIGSVTFADEKMAEQALIEAYDAFESWDMVDVEKRAAILEKAAALIEEHKSELIALCIFEAGKTWQDAIDEIRETVDFCRYYAQQARELFNNAVSLAGPTGESNQLYYEGRGVFVCISPWNFPLAIFTGQVVAALVSGNTVIAKPAEQTSLIAYKAVELLHQAGIPHNVLQLLPGSGSELGNVLNTSPLVAGVAFTGSTATARRINQTLAQRDAAIATLIAETGGLNAMLVDSTALPEQVAGDVIRSAFSSAGQRCSALRVLCVQEDVADRIIELIKGSMQELVVGNPEQYATDIGPVIDKTAQQNLLSYLEAMLPQAIASFQTALDPLCDIGTFVPPTLLEIDDISSVSEEKFGPILHVVRFQADELEMMIDKINQLQYGLTLGIHSRNTAVCEQIARRARVGNVYVNRNQVGAVVGVNPFGGRGLSGTGPKAGGPNYLLRFATEKTLSINTAAIGGNADLLAASE